ncbi:MAG: hypothetical protein V4819_11890 [Verrucomicrobiota bacterium]
MKTTTTLLTILTVSATAARAATTINATNSFAYGANIGWLNWRGDVSNGAVIGEYVCSGSIWGANVGWISLGSGAPTNGIQYGNASGTDFGVNLTGHYISAGVPRAQLRGFAYGANIGWINFEATGNPEISLSTGRLSGFAWSANCGWIDLASATAFVQTDTIRPGPDSDADGIADAFEFLYTTPDSLVLMTAVSDRDGDGRSDHDEYVADTNPLDPASALRITTFNTTSTTFSLTWTSSATRRYRIENSTSLLPGAWALSLDNILPDGSSTTRAGLSVASPQRFFRVQAFLPLAP